MPGRRVVDPGASVAYRLLETGRYAASAIASAHQVFFGIVRPVAVKPAETGRLGKLTLVKARHERMLIVA